MVWNRTSEDALKELKIWPNFSRGMSEGERYKEVNELLCALAKELKSDLWTLDALLWGVKHP
jgi:hypothetical protein